jgi:perosamine synthetase
MIPYGRQTVTDDDIAAVSETLKSDWLTTGPKVREFEEAVCRYTGAAEAVAVNSGTAALHAMIAALEIGPGDEVIVPAMTFAATSNCVVYQGGTPVFADVDPNTLQISLESVRRLITSRTRAVIAVDYAGLPCDYEGLRSITNSHGLALLSDGCHSLGGRIGDAHVGTLADMTAFSFHPVKPITTGEGGMVTTNNRQLAARMRQFRNHGISTDARQREEQGTWFYEMTTLGYNYRICDIQCALGISQLKKLNQWKMRRTAIAARYDNAFRNDAVIRPLSLREEAVHGYHLYVVRVPAEERNNIFRQLRSSGVGVNVHYIPVHLHPFYQSRFGTSRGQCPVAEAAFEQILSLPIHPTLTDAQQATVISSLRDCCYGRMKKAA